MGKAIDTSKALLEEIASNNYHWSSKRANPRRGSGRHKVDALTILASRVDALAQRLDRVATSVREKKNRVLIFINPKCKVYH